MECRRETRTRIHAANSIGARIFSMERFAEIFVGQNFKVFSTWPKQFGDGAQFG
jgi:hypothetical protein